MLRLEKRLQVKVIGRWLDLGHAHLYGVSHRISRHEDISGLKIRVPGGEANSARITALGGRPMVVPWPDLPAALDNDLVDGLLSTHATVTSARLWEHGVDYAFEDNQYFPMYVPMIARSFWQRLPGEMQEAILEAWESIVDDSRRAAAAAQDEAAETLAAHGVTIVKPDEKDVQKWRDKIMSVQGEIVSQMGMDPELVEMTIKELQGQ